MGLRHVINVTFRDDATEDQIEAAVAALRALPDQIPEVESYVVGRDKGISPGNSHLAIVADFADVAGYETYRDHPAHQAVIVDHFAPIVSGRTAVQHDT